MTIKIKDFTSADGISCRYCHTTEAASYLECADGKYTCGKCWLEKMIFHAQKRGETIEENRQKTAAKIKGKKSTTKKRGE